ncbi:GntR family transcriptional regulator/MocR family aminotransferase [Kibdelosporangium banguiense]|uniref:GntR family transcriptional regulator/MocR family aminotransferase n=1 Tax=Kibdelosporangium banguiense TaxID=1365924 RepID=A0ABS4TB58_9PSEU|nr:PLP-dependent aminotransferase family protein [Kibdelosporangium banguiense]MBP2321086.1 GntR family transcriptional regulator/MocR family aminotransferase [Kibdelosporangium banguiense]
MEFHVSLLGRDDLTGQIYQQVKEAVLDGRLRPGDVLPPTRELAVRLEVARNTVSAAYDRLTAEGFVAARAGAGTYVQAAGFERPPQPASGKGLRPRAIWDEVGVPLIDTEPVEFDFRAGVPDAKLFPYATWRRLMARQFTPTAIGSMAHDAAASHPGLCAALARHVGVSRAVRATAEDVLVTNGAQQALDLIARVLLEPGTVVAVEDPGYFGPRHMFASHGAKVVGVPVDSEGLVVDALPSNARLVYVTPSHQFPLGVPMSLPRRTALLDWAERTGAVIVEDDYDSEFRFSGRPIEPLQNIDRTGRVIYVSSLSKVLLPSLRLGFLIAPPSLRRALQAAKYVSDWQSARPLQGALAEFIDEGQFARHIRRTRREYQARHDRITAILRSDFAGLLEPLPAVAGIHLCAYLCEDAPDRDVYYRAREAGVGVYVLSAFRMKRAGRGGLVIGYGSIALSDIDSGLRRLRACIKPATIRR